MVKFLILAGGKIKIPVPSKSRARLMECERVFADKMNLFCCGYSKQTIEKVDVFSNPSTRNSEQSKHRDTKNAESNTFHR